VTRPQDYKTSLKIVCPDCQSPHFGCGTVWTTKSQMWESLQHTKSQTWESLLHTKSQMWESLLHTKSSPKHHLVPKSPLWVWDSRVWDSLDTKSQMWDGLDTKSQTHSLPPPLSSSSFMAMLLLLQRQTAFALNKSSSSSSTQERTPQGVLDPCAEILKSQSPI